MTHADDGALVRYMDGECDTSEQDLVAVHVESCATCTGRLDDLDQRARLVSGALAEWDTGVRVRRRGLPPWLRVAAAIVVLLAVAGGVRPVRALIIDGAQAVWAAVVGGSATSEGVDAPAPVLASGSVTFTPSGNSFTLQLTSRQRSGQLTIETSDRATAQAEILGGSAAEDLVVLPTGLRIVNGSEAGASYVIKLPSTLRSIRVGIGEEPPLSLEPGGATSRWEIDITLADSIPDVRNEGTDSLNG